MVAPVDPVEDGQPPHSLDRPKSELGRGWDNTTPGPADEDKTEFSEEIARLKSSSTVGEGKSMNLPMSCVSKPVPGSIAVVVRLVGRCRT